jgi:ABC-type dipeptide/oligopeptide/nickel transport system permease subunit
MTWSIIARDTATGWSFNLVGDGLRDALNPREN